MSKNYDDLDIPEELIGNPAVLSTVRQLGLKAISENALSVAGIFYTYQLLERTAEDLTKISGLGKAGVEKIKNRLEAYGTKLSEKPKLGAYGDKLPEKPLNITRALEKKNINTAHVNSLQDALREMFQIPADTIFIQNDSLPSAIPQSFSAEINIQDGEPTFRLSRELQNAIRDGSIDIEKLADSFTAQVKSLTKGGDNIDPNNPTSEIK